MGLGDFYNVKPLAESIRLGNKKDNNRETVNWLKIKVLRYEKASPNKIYFQYNYDDNENRFIPIDGVGTRRSAQQKSNVECRLQQAYNTPLPISSAKKKDLIDLCNSGAIPPRVHDFYRALPSDDSVRDALAEPDQDEESFDDEYWEMGSQGTRLVLMKYNNHWKVLIGKLLV